MQKLILSIYRLAYLLAVYCNQINIGMAKIRKQRNKLKIYKEAGELSKNEQPKILKMLKKGQITAAKGMELLETLKHDTGSDRDAGG